MIPASGSIQLDYYNLGHKPNKDVSRSLRLHLDMKLQLNQIYQTPNHVTSRLEVQLQIK